MVLFLVLPQARFSEELSCLYTIQEDYDRAKFYMANSRQSFLQVSIYVRVFSIVNLVGPSTSYVLGTNRLHVKSSLQQHNLKTCSKHCPPLLSEMGPCVPNILDEY